MYLNNNNNNNNKELSFLLLGTYGKVHITYPILKTYLRKCVIILHHTYFTRTVGFFQIIELLFNQLENPFFTRINGFNVCISITPKHFFRNRPFGYDPSIC